MTCGVPVVATAVNSVPEIVLAGKTGLLARAGDPASLTAALAYMLDHRTKPLGWRRPPALTSAGASGRRCSRAIWPRPMSSPFGSARSGDGARRRVGANDARASDRGRVSRLRLLARLGRRADRRGRGARASGLRPFGCLRARVRRVGAQRLRDPRVEPRRSRRLAARRRGRARERLHRGFDLRLRCGPEGVELTYRWRPPARDRAAAWALRSRFHLLARAVLMQYPALWWAGTRGRAPLHASACTPVRRRRS